jgi:hypothetical protein
MMKDKEILITLAVVGLILWARSAFAKTVEGGAQDVTRDGTAGVSPLNSSNIAQAEKSGTAALPLRRLALPLGSGTFQNPKDALSRYQYSSETVSAYDAPIRPDYAFNPRSTVVVA